MLDFWYLFNLFSEGDFKSGMELLSPELCFTSCETDLMTQGNLT